MKDKSYRELQFSSAQLVFVFIAILVLGIFIFLLGISVGKKQAQLAARAEMPMDIKTTETADQAALPGESSKSSVSPELESPLKSPQEGTKLEAKPDVRQKDVKGTESQPEIKEPKAREIVPVKKGNYFIQIGAFTDRESASVHSQKFKKEGYPTIVLDPFPSDRKPVFRVRIGGFETPQEAEKVRMKLKSSSSRKSDYFIVKG
ncbi:MAG: SPOR domain-containing protein [Candidatus Aminicenantales bacterium]